MVDGKQFTSNTSKLVQHLDKLQGLKNGVISPVMVHVAPVNVCNLDCPYCCYGGRTLGDSLTLDQVISAQTQFRQLGTLGLEYTGGGEPTLFKQLNEATDHAKDIGYKIGLITNAIKFDWFDRFDKLEWMRASLHGFNEHKEARIERNVAKALEKNPDLTVSAVYIWTKGSEDVFPKVAEFVNKYKIPTRITPDLTLGKQSIDFMMGYVGDYVKKYGDEYAFLSDFNVQTDRKHDHCYQHMLKPFVFPDGWVYPCPSVGLVPEQFKNVGNPLRVCKIEDILEHYSQGAYMRKHDCSFCKYSAQNELVDDILRPTQHKEFA
jgi:MoaA/NifB/PqqE/SkfB family radical SAM enzyme